MKIYIKKNIKKIRYVQTGLEAVIIGLTIIMVNGKGKPADKANGPDTRTTIIGILNHYVH